MQQTSDLLRYLDKRVYREEPKIVKKLVVDVGSMLVVQYLIFFFVEIRLGEQATFTKFITNNSDYLQKARKYGHFTGYKN